jgi:hypothetical protein
MQALNLPSFETKICERDGKQQIFDPIRKCYVTLTPEEWVRQHFVHYLTDQKGYPSSLMGNEVSIMLNGMKRRCDTVVYDRQLQPRMIVEYKAPGVKITREVFAQISRYNLTLRVDYLIISNGLQHYCCKMDYNRNGVEFLTDIPDYENMLPKEKKE